MHSIWSASQVWTGQQALAWMLEQTVVAAIYQVWLELKGARLLRAMSQQVRGTARLPAEALSRLLLLVTLRLMFGMQWCRFVVAIRRRT